MPRPTTIDNYNSVNEHMDRLCARFDVQEDMDVFTPLTPESKYGQPFQVFIRPNDRRKTKRERTLGRIRVCMDASRNLNDFGPKWSFRYADISQVTRMLTKDCFCASIDLSDFYLNIPLARESRRFCTFTDRREGGFRSYKYVLFGLANAPAWASVISSELCEMFRAAGVSRCSAYIDDIICMGATREECQAH